VAEIKDLATMLNHRKPFRQSLFITALLIASLISTRPSYSQNLPQQGYPKVTGYMGVVHPLVTISNGSADYNFDGHYVMGVPTGINIWKSANIGFTMEFVPYVRVEGSVSKMSNLLFHPGVLVALGKGYTFAGRAAFETSGRFGFTPILNKVLVKGHSSSLFVALPLPVRFGNAKPTSFTAAFQFGIAF
jgi:hypothetical protein